MKKPRFIKKVFLFALPIILFFAVVYSHALFMLPGRITLIQGEEYIYDFNSPLNVHVYADRNGVIRLNGNIVDSGANILALSRPVTLMPLGDGTVRLNIKLFGFVPLKTVVVDVYPNLKVVPCGNTVGVKIHTQGVLVIGVSDVECTDGKRYEPAKSQGIKPGDIIVRANGQPLKNIEQLMEQIEKSGGKNIYLECKRAQNFFSAVLRPVRSKEDNKFRIGLWVRDSTAGIGTLTFYEPSSMVFGALGHGITDIDTGSLLTVEHGEILCSNILSVRKGIKGNPGELKGVFMEDGNIIGSIRKNCEFGIFGIISDITGISWNNPIPICLSTQVKEGPAVILSNIEGNKVEAFDIIISKVSRQNVNSPKGMMIQVTDRDLLNRTGGIVQGMSGSPIIQGKKLAGAVTHVMINKPEYGYGVFIECMLRQIDG